MDFGLDHGSLLGRIPLTLSRHGGHQHRPLHDKAAAVRKVLKKLLPGVRCNFARDDVPVPTVLKWSFKVCQLVFHVRLLHSTKRVSTTTFTGPYL